MSGSQRPGVPSPPLYLRLALTEPDEESFQGRGVFTSAYELLNSGELSPEDSAFLKTLIVWFEQNLPLPDRSRLESRAIFWFKVGAGETADRAWELARFLKRHGPRVELLRTRRPGRIVYEDDAQIAAVPFRDTFAGPRRRDI